MTTASPEARVRELGLQIPDYSDPPYGGRYGTMKPFHRAGQLVTLSGLTPETRDGTMLHPGRLGNGPTDLSIEQGYAAARFTATNLLGLIRLAIGSLDEVCCLVSTLCFVVTTPDFTGVNKVTMGASDLLVDVFGDAAGRATSAGIGVMSLSRGNCYEMIATVESRT